MNRGRHYATVMPIAGILYAVALVIHGYGKVTLVEVFCFALLGIGGTLFYRGGSAPAR